MTESPQAFRDVVE